MIKTCRAIDKPKCEEVLKCRSTSLKCDDDFVQIFMQRGEGQSCVVFSSTVIKKEVKVPGVRISASSIVRFIDGHAYPRRKLTVQSTERN